MVMNKKTQENKRRAKVKPNAASSTAKAGPATKNVIDARRPKCVHQEDVPRYESDEGPIDAEYFEWMKKQAQLQISQGDVVFGRSLLDLENSDE
jgi:hypothetical protein